MKINILILSFLITLTSWSQHNTYYVGHSGFGWDLIVGEMVNDLAADAGIGTYNYNYQFIGGSCLSTQWQDHATPQGGTDSWVELPNGYDVVVLAEQIPIQEVIYSSPWGCDLTSVQSVDNFYDLAKSGNPNARIYLMEFHNEIDQTGPDPYGAWTQMNTDMRPLWEQVADSVGLVNNGEVCIVPVAAAFQSMVDSVIAGSFPGITNWIDLFDPNDPLQATIHPTEVTYYLAACVHYATIFGTSPVGLTNQTFAAAGWAFDAPTPAQALMMQQIAWETVMNDPYVCLPTASIEEENKAEFQIYPNPSSAGDIVIATTNQTGALRIFDSMGRLVSEHAIGSKGIQLQLDAGVYLFEYSASTSRTVEKLIVK